MSNTEKVQVLKSVFGTPHKTGAEYLFHCPKCKHHNRKLSINVEKDKFKCWICDWSGSSISRAIRKYGSHLQRERWQTLVGQVDISSFQEIMEGLLTPEEDVIHHDVPLPEEFISLANKNLEITAIPAYNYLIRDRGLTHKDIVRWKIGCCVEGPYAGRVIIPSFSNSGDVNYFIARTYDDNYRKYLNPPVSKDVVFNELYVDWKNDLSIVEGVFDAIIAQNAVPLLGSVVKENSYLFQEIVKHDTPVYIALDSDAEKKAMHLIKQLMSYDVEIYKVNISPYNDVGEMSQDEYLQRKNKAQEMHPGMYISDQIKALFA